MTYKEIELNKLIIYDIETLKQCIIFNFLDVATQKRKSFVFFDHARYIDQPFALYKFLRNCIRTGYTFVGFNNLAFDAQIVDYFYSWCCEVKDPLYERTIAYIIDQLYTKAQEITSVQQSEDRYKSSIPEYELFAPQIDVYKQKHFDRMQKATSLKWIQFSIRYPNIEEMPISHDDDIIESDIETIISYCWNDVDSTYKFFTLIRFETELRMELSALYNKNLINASEPRMAREIFSTILAPQMGVTYGELKKLQTIRKYVHFKDIILPYVSFITPQLKEVLTKLHDITVDCNPHNKDTFTYNLAFADLDIYLALGGIHACVQPGVYTPKEDERISDDDVKSFYPNLAIKNNLRPEHLGESFSKVYADIYEQRTHIPKTDKRNYVYKILLNSAYGLSSEINSYLYDKQFTYGITINGQLTLLMYIEALTVGIPNIKILQANTDGVTYVYNVKYQHIVDKIRSWWQKLTKLELEAANYSKMIILDVNNYIAVYTDGKVKKKGRFETELDLHKNPTHLVIPKAIEQYFINNTPVEDYIRKSSDIYDLCGGIKRKSNFKLNLYKTISTAEVIEPQQKVTRYIVSNSKAEAGLLVKDFDDGRRVSALANTLVQPLNFIKDADATHYDINYSFYIKAAKKIVESITPPVTQTTLF